MRNQMRGGWPLNQVPFSLSRSLEPMLSFGANISAIKSW